MKIFLIIVGALVTAFVICLLLLVLWLRWLTRGFRKSIEKMGDLAGQLGQAVPPLRIKLRQLGTSQWQRGAEAEALIEPLRLAGFDEIGCFAMEPSEVLLQAFCLKAESVLAIVYEHPQAGVWLDLVTRYRDGSKITYATLRDTLLDRQENNVIRFHAGIPADELLTQFMAERPQKPMAPVAVDDFPGYFERAYAESMDWIISRGGPTEEEIRRQCEARGEECSPLMVMAVRGAWSAAIDAFYQDQLKERFLADSRVNASRWEQIRDRIVFIHDRIDSDRLQALCEHEFDEDEDDSGLYDTRPASSVMAQGSISAREIFARWNSAARNRRKYEKIGELSVPVAADVYVSPEDDG